MQHDTKATPGPLDAFETLKPDERHFTVQEFDPLSVATVKYWAQLARAEGLKLQDEGKLVEAVDLLKRATAAEELAWDFEARQKGHAELKEHDQEAHAGESKEDAEWRLAHFNLLTHVIERLHNSIAEVNDQIANIDKLDVVAKSDARRETKAAWTSLRRAVGLLEPKRKLR